MYTGCGKEEQEAVLTTEPLRAFSKLILASNRASSLIMSPLTAIEAGHITKELKYSETPQIEVKRGEC